MKQIYEQIWKLALPYQDKRDDEGHAEIIRDYAIELAKLEDGNEEVIAPAAIMHDIGWSQMSEKERMSCFKKDSTEIRIKHQKEGVKLAEDILTKLNYNQRLIKEILDIILRHDTGMGFKTKNEGIVRDADKLWRFSKIGFWTDHRKINLSKKEHCEKLRKNIDDEDFFYSESAKKIARRELEKREEEFES